MIEGETQREGAGTIGVETTQRNGASSNWGEKKIKRNVTRWKSKEKTRIIDARNENFFFYLLALACIWPVAVINYRLHGLWLYDHCTWVTACRKVKKKKNRKGECHYWGRALCVRHKVYEFCLVARLNLYIAAFYEAVYYFEQFDGGLPQEILDWKFDAVFWVVLSFFPCFWREMRIIDCRLRLTSRGEFWR